MAAYCDLWGVCTVDIELLNITDALCNREVWTRLYVNILLGFEFCTLIRYPKYICFNCKHSWDPNI